MKVSVLSDVALWAIWGGKSCFWHGDNAALFLMHPQEAPQLPDSLMGYVPHNIPSSCFPVKLLLTSFQRSASTPSSNSSLAKPCSAASPWWLCLSGFLCFNHCQAFPSTMSEPSPTSSFSLERSRRSCRWAQIRNRSWPNGKNSSSQKPSTIRTNAAHSCNWSD